MAEKRRAGRLHEVRSVHRRAIEIKPSDSFLRCVEEVAWCGVLAAGSTEVDKVNPMESTHLVPQSLVGDLALPLPQCPDVDK